MEIYNCTLEVNEAGTIYIHGPQGTTLMRIGGLPKKACAKDEFVDIAIHTPRKIVCSGARKCKPCDGYGRVGAGPKRARTSKKCPDCKGSGWEP